jgi:hypothetical protein
VLEKPSEKLLVAEDHQGAPAVMRIIFPSKRHMRIGHIDKTMIGDGDAVFAKQTPTGRPETVGVAGQIMQHVLRSAEWFLRIDDAVLAEQRAQKSRECLFLIQRLAGTLNSNGRWSRSCMFTKRWRSSMENCSKAA